MHHEEQESYLLGDGASDPSPESDAEHEKPGFKKSNNFAIYATFLGE